MINIIKESKHSCCGCHAFVKECSTKCIHMESDEEGFKYPIIDQNKCIKCNKCERVCPII